MGVVFPHAMSVDHAPQEVWGGYPFFSVKMCPLLAWAGLVICLGADDQFLLRDIRRE